MIALIAGEGDLPGVVATALRAQGAAFAVYHMAGHAPRGLESKPFQVECLGSFLKALHKDGVAQVCFAGAVSRPRIDPTLIDAETLPLVPRMMQAMGAGDDAALRVALALFEEAGIAPVAAHALCPDLLPPAGTLVGALAEGDHADLARARSVHAGLAPLDIGQGVVVAAGQVLAVEALPGTDWMLRSLTVPFARPSGGVFYKAPKAGQDRRIDLPVIGPETLRLAAAAGLNGVILEAGGVMILDRAATCATAQEAGLFLHIHEPKA